MTSKGQAAILLVVAAIGVSGLCWAAWLHEQKEDAAAQAESAPVADASADARTKVTKGKAVAKKKKRGGKTRVTGRTGGGAKRPSGATHPTAAPHPTVAKHPTGGSAPEDQSDDHGGGSAPAHPRAHGHHVGPSGPSYESAVDSNNQHLTMGAHSGPDLTDAQLSAPMSDGTFIGDCGAPDDMGVTVKVAIKMGHAVGVSVSTSPPAADVAGCIDHHVRKLSWPQSPKLDSFVTTY